MMIRRWIAAISIYAGLTVHAQAFDLSAMSPQEREAFGEAVREFLLENPQVIMDAVAVLEERKAQEQARADLELVSQNSEALFNDSHSWVGGNPEGDITLVEFLDYRCGYCKRAHPEVAKLLESDGNIRLIVKEFPILGDQSVLASRYAIATKLVAGDAAYKQMSDALIAFDGNISMPALNRMARGFDLDADQIEQQMAREAVSEELLANRALAQNLQISGTPTFVLEDEMLRGFLPYDQLSAIVAEKRG